MRKRFTGFGGFLHIGLFPALLILAMLILQPTGMALTSLLAAVLHECGHLAAAWFLGIHLRSLDIGPIGATIRIRGSLISYRDEWMLCAAGPAANLISAAIAFILFRRNGNLPSAAVDFCAVSVMLAILNLLPIDGFDGGRMLSCVVGSLFGPRVASVSLDICSFLSIVILWMLSVYLLMCFGTSLSLFVFTLSVFGRVFIRSEER